MADNTGYEYVNEECIGERSICTIYTKPLVDPVSTKCKIKSHIFCRHYCIEKWVKHYSLCDTCIDEFNIEDLIPVTDKELIDALNRISVKCVDCQQTGLTRGDFQNHKTKMCPRTNVSCPSSDIKCSWIGPRDQLDKHLDTCIFNLLRPLIIHFENNQEIKIVELQNENQQLRGQIKQFEGKKHIYLQFT